MKLANFNGVCEEARIHSYHLANAENKYSHSEVTIGCAARFMYRNTRKENVGRVFDNCSAYVIDDKLNVVPRGVWASC